MIWVGYTSGGRGDLLAVVCGSGGRVSHGRCGRRRGGPRYRIRRTRGYLLLAPRPDCFRGSKPEGDIGSFAMFGTAVSDALLQGVVFQQVSWAW